MREQVQRRYNEEIQHRLAPSVWNSGGCVSWYLDERGRNTAIWPGSTWPYRRRLQRFHAEDYELRRRAPAKPLAAPARALASAL